MAGNEIKVARFLFDNLKSIELPHLGVINLIGAPKPDGGIEDILLESNISLIATQDSVKKADIYLNNFGVSIKQSGSSFSFNRIQRKNLLDLFSYLHIAESSIIINKLDKAILDFHSGKVEGRNRPWQDFFDDFQFKVILEFLMMRGSPNIGVSTHPASFILEAPQEIIQKSDIKTYSFGEYFEEYSGSLSIALRRQWIGQMSKSEHSRAVGIAKKKENEPWVFKNIVGKPRPNRDGQTWRTEIPQSDRRTVYILFIEKK